eukprot:CAMPEP_0117035958 /NCGR_PEP_ID=MMETSP0472-20121206/25505_1 /TAXON_ID=693140 ORGANISM="Tiarina fusus, Strain LIS" /NCGR_SAMPLE_ID=MMETSP0472 /ASSEMBLY_ACC=CAM_ASM_000603 /LENGTH=291 /DNA_ID=CAMNT_0004745581 /DNA_START=122 /DNA_END=997 /DNA_ORIENTATION=-
MASSSLAFLHPLKLQKGASHTSSLNMVASVDTPPGKNNNDHHHHDNNIDIKEMLLARYQAVVNQESSQTEEKANKPDLSSTAVAGAALGVVAHSPLLIGAALGFAGSQLLDGDNAGKTMEAMEEIKQALEKSVHGTITLAHETIEQEGDLSKLPSKVVQAMLMEKVNENMDGLKVESDKAWNGIAAFLSSDQLKQVQEQAMQAIRSEDLKDRALDNVKHILESEELKEAPANAFNAFTSFLNSDQVRQAREQAVKAVKDGLESEEMKALQSKASKALEEAIETKTKPQQQH